MLPVTPLKPLAPPVTAALSSPTESLYPGVPPGVKLRDPRDPLQTRAAIYSNVFDALSQVPPYEDDKHRIVLKDIAWADPERFTRKQRKEAVLHGRTLGRRVSGTWELYDKAGNLIDTKKQTIARVPYMTSLGTFTYRGTDYTITNQPRLRSGVFTRRKNNGELESHANIDTGKGPSHRYTLDPARGVFKLGIGNSEMPLMPLLRELGATDKEMREAWGDSIFNENMLARQTTTIGKLLTRMLPKRDLASGDEGMQRKKLVELFNNMTIDSDVTKRTLGKPLSSMGKDTLLAITSKLLRVNRGEEDVDDRDHLAYMSLFGPEDLFAERIRKDHGRLRQQAFRDVSRTGSLSRMPVGLFTKQLDQVLLGSKLGMAIEEINPAEVLDKQTRITRLGEGGISSTDAIPAEARNVHPSQLGFVDPVRTPESLRAGIDLNLASGVRKGSDGNIYTRMRDRSGKYVYRNPRDLLDSAVTVSQYFSDAYKDYPRIPTLRQGKVDYLPREAVDYVIDDYGAANSSLSNLVAIQSTTKAGRLQMGSRYITQALPLRDPEAPFVQSLIRDGDGRTYDQDLATSMGAVRASADGTVISVSPDAVKVRYADGKTEDIELYNNHPFSRKTFIHQTPRVAPGDTFKRGDTIIRSNYTDKDGVTALGANFRTAYIPWHGINFKDAIVISESAAKRLASEHMYQEGLTQTPKHKLSRKDYVSMYPAKYTREQLNAIDGNGLIKPGSVVSKGQPLILAIREQDRAENKVHRRGSSAYTDDSVVWDHADEGIVVDVAQSKDGPLVTVKAYSPMQVADKLCYSGDTRVLTFVGWKDIKDVRIGDLAASIDPQTGMLSYVPVVAVTDYVADELVQFKSADVDLLVTTNHQMCLYDGDHTLQFAVADSLVAKTCVMFRGCNSYAGVTRGYTVPDGMVDTAYAALCGLVFSHASFCPETDVVAFKDSAEFARIRTTLRRLSVPFSVVDHVIICTAPTVVRIARDMQFVDGLPVLPAEFLHWSDAMARMFFSWFMSERRCETLRARNLVLPETYQQMLLHAGACASRSFFYTRPAAVVPADGVTRLTAPTHVYGITLASNHTLYVQRNGLSLWSGNSGRYGDKGVVSAIIPDEKMPHDSEGKPFEVLLSPQGIISRTNPAQVFEGWLGKIARKTGKPYPILDFSDNQLDMVEFVSEQLKRHGLSSTDTLLDPTTGRKVKDIATGERFLMKLHHTSEAKNQGRGTGAYTADGMPAKGGCFVGSTLVTTDHGAQRIDDICKYESAYNTVYGQITAWFTNQAPTADVIIVELEDGRELVLTRDHVVYLADGSAVQAGDLVPGIDLMEHVDG